MHYLNPKLKTSGVPAIRVDIMSMGARLKCREPLLDHKFVELTMSIPQDLKTKNKISKYILKKAVRGLIPDELIKRKNRASDFRYMNDFLIVLGKT